MIDEARWSSRSERLGDRCLRYTLAIDSRPATFADVLRALREEDPLRNHLNELLAEAPFRAFRWETPCVTAATLDRPFELVLLDSPGLASRPDPAAFAEHFGAEDVVTFANLGGDAVLVVPRPLGEPSAYGHLAAFVRHAPAHQRSALWRAVGEAMQKRVSDEPVWLSTAGAGVSWLHVRLDDRPKYYGHAPYRAAPL